MYVYTVIVSLACDSFYRNHTTKPVCVHTHCVCVCRCPMPDSELFISRPCLEQTLTYTAFPSASVPRVKMPREALTLPS